MLLEFKKRASSQLGTERNRPVDRGRDVVRVVDLHG